jgi:hypothetical protein
MARPFTLAQQAENRRFLDMLAETGNARLAARELGVHRATYTKRRARCAAFAQDWDAACAAAHARFHLAGGPRAPEGKSGAEAGADGRLAVPKDRGRTRGGEPHVVRVRGRLQLRLAPPGRMTRGAEQAFLAALSASANVRLSAAAAGFAHSSFYRKRGALGWFAREMRLALKMGFERLEMAALSATLAEHHEFDDWRLCEPPPIPPMSFSQMLQLLYLHEKSVRQGWDLPHRRRRRGEPWEVYRERLAAMWTFEKRREAEDAALRRAERFEASGSWRHEDEPERPALPPLELVTGWSRESGRPPHKEGVALFGGWRIAEMERKLRGK